MDPVGNISFYLAELKKVSDERVQSIVIRELLIALVVLVGFLFVGKYFMKILPISQPALTVGGGIILFLIAIKMIFPSKNSSLQVDVGGEPFIVPLAIPYVAGPSALATELLLMSQEPDRWPEWLLAVFLAWLASGIIIYFGSGLKRFLNEKGLIAIERLMGLVLITIAIEMVMTGISDFITSI
jgi:multiple antibiotic resistance protein